MLLQIDPNEVMKVSPYNALGYGLLVLVLILGIGILWRAWRAARLENTENLKNTVGVLTQVNSHLDKEGVTEKAIAAHDANVHEQFAVLNTKIDNLKKD